MVLGPVRISEDVHSENVDTHEEEAKWLEGIHKKLSELGSSNATDKNSLEEMMREVLSEHDRIMALTQQAIVDIYAESSVSQRTSPDYEPATDRRVVGKERVRLAALAAYYQLGKKYRDAGHSETYLPESHTASTQ